MGGDPLTVDEVMYGASLTKAVVGYHLMQLVDAGRFDLDRPLAEYLAKPLPDYGDVEGYADWSPLADDPRWRTVTGRHALTHSVGFSNFGFAGRPLALPLRPGCALRLFRRLLHPAAVRAGAGRRARAWRIDADAGRSAGHDPHQPAVARRFRREPRRRLEAGWQRRTAR